MRKSTLWALLFFTSSALGQITDFQSAHTWNTTSTPTCTVTLGATNSTDLLVVWATWSPSTLTVSSVHDNSNSSFPSAVGPTIQSASNTATGAGPAFLSDSQSQHAGCPTLIRVLCE
jgi:hypothetical protein